MDLEYTLFRENVNSQLISKIIEEIMDSKEIEIADELEEGQLSHVVIKGTKTPIAYIGDDNLEFVNYNNEALKKYHELFIDIYNKSSLTCLITLN
jgi:predicted regulator of Ras-like GTPase activity (Roadblock/LC7/MglB family)